MKTTTDTHETHYNRITFHLNGTLLCEDIPAGISTLDWLHNVKQLWGTKCSCNEGDCGACTVVIAYPRADSVVYEAINSCLYPAAKLHGRHLITVEGLGTPDALHPIQTALLEHHGTQCGYCTPGFVMSMFALFATHAHPSREVILAALEGNLCRCTGYQTILEAAGELAMNTNPEQIKPEWCIAVEDELWGMRDKPSMRVSNTSAPELIHSYLQPETMKSLFDFIAVEREAVLIAGGTDIMVQKNISRKSFPVLIDLTRIPELQILEMQPDGLHIGAAITYSQLLDCGAIQKQYPAFSELLKLIASNQIRNFGTLAGNIANASPVGDTIPLLMAMGATLRLQTECEVRHLPLRDFFTGYRKTALQKGEIIREVILPLMPEQAYLRTIKSAKRKSVDISSVLTALYLETEAGIITKSILALGGVAATPVLSRAFPSQIQSRTLSDLDIKVICNAVAEEFSPLSDVRGSAEYRRQLIINHLTIYLNELKGGKP